MKSRLNTWQPVATISTISWDRALSRTNFALLISLKNISRGKRQFEKNPRFQIDELIKASDFPLAHLLKGLLQIYLYTLHWNKLGMFFFQIRNCTCWFRTYFGKIFVEFARYLPRVSNFSFVKSFFLTNLKQYF